MGFVLESPGIDLWFKLIDMHSVEFGLKRNDSEFQNIWHPILLHPDIAVCSTDKIT